MKKLEELLGPTIWLLFVLIAFVGAWIGYPAALIYILVIKVVYSVIVSILIQSWKNSESVLVESGKDSWIINIHGIPVTETTNSLKNLHFKSERLMRVAYYKFLIPKFIITVGLLFLSFQSISTIVTVNELSLSSLVGYFTVAFMLYKTIHCISLINKVNSNTWMINEYIFGEHTFYSAYISKYKKYCSPYLVEVFK
ncbi:hypothetical protein [Photobacterium sp. OFAV2-7]|uniref:hypothetical protein n=1 Tax=Photobacterium sp. OFAV2-7 TaxID=2917748 RepID=UPI001EF72726|nr:hypothetical protein [Photobacterium sp. OFAV2-7]MCG7588168.1 hypothetical protein [Photobacterium sp. OFAV2-7]